MTESVFLQDMAMLMTVSGIVAVAFAKLKWPKVLGYIAAGVFMSRYTWGGSFLADEQSVRTIGQLGVVFLMFSMGLDFSPSQIKRMKSVAFPIALVDTVVMTWIGYTVGTSFLGWGAVPSLFLGVAICDSATTMLAKVIDEMKWSQKPFVRYALGTSICEDIICVGLIAVVTGVAQGRGISILAAGMSLGGLLVFFLAVIVFGMILVPRLLASVAKTRDDEALIMTILGVCFFVSWMALKLDFSLALGAFLVGIIGASSDVHKRLADLSAPFKAMFASMFFVSIGLLVDPMACLRQWPTILVLTAVVMGGKFVNCTVGALLSGQSVRTSVQMGMSLAQIGEFAFMVAIIYESLTGDETCPMYEVVVAVSVLTTLLNPLMIRWSDPVGRWVEGCLPASSRSHFETYRGFVAKLQSSERDMMTHRIVRTCVLQLAIIGVLILAVAISFGLLGKRDWSNLSVLLEDHKRFVFCLLANLFIVAMLVPVLRVGRTLGRAFAMTIVGVEETRWQQALRNAITLAVVAGTLVLLFCEMSMVNVNLAPEETWARWTIRVILLVAGIGGWRVCAKAVDRASMRFSEALGAEERRQKIVQMMTFTVPEDHVSRLTLDATSPAIGATVVSLNIRAKTGATVVSIERDGSVLRNIGPQTEFRIGDTLVAVGEGGQIAALKDLLGIVA